MPAPRESDRSPINAMGSRVVSVCRQVPVVPSVDFSFSAVSLEVALGLMDHWSPAHGGSVLAVERAVLLPAAGMLSDAVCWLPIIRRPVLDNSDPRELTIAPPPSKCPLLFDICIARPRPDMRPVSLPDLDVGAPAATMPYAASLRAVHRRISPTTSSVATPFTWRRPFFTF